jgi:glycosyltransferase involved in cell wall biosynthesis
MKPLISVIIPTKNSANNLRNLLESLYFSNYKNFEIIVNDDVTSDDDTTNLCKEYISKGLSVIYKK